MSEKGIIILDKESRIISFKACDKVKNKLDAKKAGHAGTLDPNVTGILIIATDEAVKTLALFSHLDKIYEGKAHLHKEIQEKELKKEIKKLTGKITQLPPKKSRVKRQERERKVYDFKLIKKQGKNFSFKVHCEAGTYIRKLIHDLGKNIGGAHMTELRRIQQGPFEEKEAKKFKDISEKDIIPIEQAIKRLNVPIIPVSKQEAESLKQGKFIKTKEKEQEVVIFSENKLIALAKIEKDFIKPKRII